MTTPTAGGSNLQEQTAALSDWARAHTRQLAIGGIAVAAAVVVFFVFRASKAADERSAIRELAAAQRSVGSGNLPLAAADLKKLTTRFGSTRAGAEGRILLARVQLLQGDPAAALVTLKEASTSGPLAPAVYNLRGAAHEQAGRPLEAAAEYVRAASASEMASEKAGFKASAARAYATAGKKDEAVEIWRELALDASSPLYAEAQLRLGELTATVAN